MVRLNIVHLFFQSLTVHGLYKNYYVPLVYFIDVFKIIQTNSIIMLIKSLLISVRQFKKHHRNNYLFVKNQIKSSMKIQ